MADRIPTLPGAPLNVIESKIDPTSARFEKNMRAMAELVSTMRNQEEEIALGGGEKAIESQHKKGRLTARERIKLLVDPATEFFELGIYAAYRMYEEWGGAPSAGVVTGLGRVQGRHVHDHRERRHGESRRVLPDDGEESHPRAEHRHREPHSHDLSGRFGRRVPAAAGRRLPRHRRLRPRLPQQRSDVGDGRSRRSRPSWACASPAAPTFR